MEDTKCRCASACRNATRQTAAASCCNLRLIVNSRRPVGWPQRCANTYMRVHAYNIVCMYVYGCGGVSLTHSWPGHFAFLARILSLIYAQLTWIFALCSSCAITVVAGSMDSYYFFRVFSLFCGSGSCNQPSLPRHKS